MGTAYIKDLNPEQRINDRKKKKARRRYAKANKKGYRSRFK